MPPYINEEKCLRCGQCVEICPMDCFYGSCKGEVPVVSYPEECWHAEACVLHCPAGAIEFRIPLTIHIPYKKLPHENAGCKILAEKAD